MAPHRQDHILESLFQVLPDLFFVFDPDGMILDYRANRASSLYIAPAAFLGKRVDDVLPPDVASGFHASLSEAGRSGSVATFQYRLPMGDGSVHAFESRLARILDGERYVSVVRDVTTWPGRSNGSRAAKGSFARWSTSRPFRSSSRA